MMWLPVAFALTAATPPDLPIPPLAEPETPPATAPATAPAASAAGPAQTHAAPASLTPWAIGLELGLDIPAAQRFPMASTRLGIDWRTPLAAGVFGGVGLLSGYSYVAGEQAVADPVLGVDEHALVMAHRIPLRARLRLGLDADGAPVAVGLQASGGADIAVVSAQSFGRQASLTSVMPALSVGGFLNIAMGPQLGLGVVGEWDSAQADLAAAAPGLSGDLSAFRLAILMTFGFG